MDEIELEVFRADTRASRGITAAQLIDAASSYDPETAPAGICLGHPKNDTPAYGRVKAFRADGPSLFATIPVDPQLVEGVKADRLLNRSMAFFDPRHEANPKPGTLYPRHLGFLGASAPGIPGMQPLTKALAFSAEGVLEATGDPAEAILYEAPPTPVFSVVDSKEPTNMDPTAEQKAESDRIKAEADQLAADRLAFEAEQRTTRETANGSLVDSLVTAGKVLPADAPALKLVFNALAPEPIEFSADKKISPAAELARLLGTGVKLVPVDEGRRSPTQQFNADEIKQDDKQITAAARKLMSDDKSLAFEAAVARVTEQEED